MKILATEKVATAGSCFAQHISRHLRSNGFNYYVAEDLPPALSAARDDHQYGTFSARYGNIYTARQLVNLWDRAFHNFIPDEKPWEMINGRIADPFRPNVQPNGYLHEAEMLSDRERHLSSVRQLFQTCDVFIFTLGLTEHWRSKIDGAAFPVCPGVAAGVFSPDIHEFANQSVAEVTADMRYFIDELKSINPLCRVVITVSPVPLAATAIDRNVLISTIYSKSVLRVAAETICSDYTHVAYFPSYEIITGSYNRGAYFDDGLRDVTVAGVNHVMRIFSKHVLTEGISNIPHTSQPPEAKMMEQVEKATQVMCDEVMLDQ